MVRDPVPSRQAEYLESSRIGQDRTVPAHERMEAAQSGDCLFAWPKRQVIGIGQKHARSGCAELVGSEPLDRGLCSNRHERGCLDQAVRSFEPPQPSGRSTIDGHGGKPDRAIRIARSEFGEQVVKQRYLVTSKLGFGQIREPFEGWLSRVPSTSVNQDQSFFSFSPSVVSLSRTSLSEVTPKFLHSRSSSPLRLARSPTV